MEDTSTSEQMHLLFVILVTPKNTAKFPTMIQPGDHPAESYSTLHSGKAKPGEPIVSIPGAHFGKEVSK